jgi:transposase
VLNEHGEVDHRARIATSRVGFRKWFSELATCTVVVETGTHSRWVAQLLSDLGHEVIVANARHVRLIYHGHRKNDRLDAEKLARLARADIKLLRPIKHRSDATQTELALLRNRDQLVAARTQLINHVRGVAKSFGVRIRKCDAASFGRHAHKELPEALHQGMQPLLAALQAVSDQIKAYDKQLSELAQANIEVQPILQIGGVGPITALAYVHTIEDPERFARNRDAAAFFGLVPGQNQSGSHDPALSISKAGDGFVRRLLINCAQYILGPFGKDCDLRRYGLRLQERGGSHAKKKAVVAVARKLAVLMLHLWKTGEVYEPLHAPQRRLPKAA